MKRLGLPTALAFIMLSVASCAGNSSKTADTTQQDTAKKVAAEIQMENKSVEAAVKQYLVLKDALVESDLHKSQQAASSLADKLKAVEGCENTATVANDLAKATDLKLQREKFSLLTNDMTGLADKAHMKSGSLFVEYCPMANDGDGAYWLAAENEIRNPYFGSKMLNCGEVKKEIKAQQ